MQNEVLECEGGRGRDVMVTPPSPLRVPRWSRTPLPFPPLTVLTPLTLIPAIAAPPPLAWAAPPDATKAAASASVTEMIMERFRTDVIGWPFLLGASRYTPAHANWLLELVTGSKARRWHVQIANCTDAARDV